MSHLIKMIEGYKKAPSQEMIEFNQKNLQVSFPDSFLACIRQTDEGRPENSYFKFLDLEHKTYEWVSIGAFLSFYPENKFNILRSYFNRPKSIPPHLIPFADIGNGDLICFDYSISGWEDKNPPVVYWNHEKANEYAVIDLAINFEEFLKKLKPCPEDEEE